MTILTPELRQTLRRTRIVAGRALAQGGVGERRSRNKGDGIEFEDFRPYAFGDDMRRLDPYVHARLGQHVIREYNVPERLSVTILLDVSGSMVFGEPSKADLAAGIVAGLALCALAGSDAVRCGSLRGDRVDWYSRLSGTGRFEELEAWLSGLSQGGPTGLAAALTMATAALPAHGLVILVSDMWFTDVKWALDMLADANQTVVVVQVLSPEEIDPARYGVHPVRLVDSETGEEVDLELGRAAFDLYRELAERSATELRESVLRVGGRLVRVRSDSELRDVFQRALPAAAIIR